MDENILIVGCGGLGCEIIKVLSSSVNLRITLIDDDTIDLTNLNRQFLFCSEDVGRSKAVVVAEKMRSYFKNNIVSHTCKIQEFKKISFYSQFDVVFNCLDNDEARSFINERCHVTNTRMIDGGSAGWYGQSFNNKEQCFDCLPKRIEKIYPVCTVRQRPQNFEHCIIWARNVILEKDKRSILEEASEHELLIRKAGKNDSINDYSTLLTDNKENEDIILFKNDLTSENQHDDSHRFNNRVIENNKQNLKNVITELGSDSEEIEVIRGSKKNNYLNEKDNETTDFNTKRQKFIHYQRNVEDSDDFNKIDINEFIENDNYLLDMPDSTVSIFKLASIRALRFNIKALSILDTQTIIKKIIPSVSTTNSIIASLMIMSYKNSSNYFLVQGSKLLLRTCLERRKDNCTTCSLPVYSVSYGKLSTVDDFMIYFHAQFLIINTNFYEAGKCNSNLLLEYDGCFGIATKNENNYKIYFTQNGDTIKTQRMK